MESGQMFKIVSRDIAQQRYDICKSCPRLTVLKLCNICNCIMPVKVKFAQAECPAGKWRSIDDPQYLQSDPYEDLN